MVDKPVTTQTSTWHGEPPSGRDPGVPRAVPGTMIGKRYQLRAAIGNGGMGTVWQASDTLLHRDVAVKEVLLPPGMARADREAMCERTLREARAAAALSHPSVVQVYDVVTEGGRPWIVMELLHARSLAEIIISDGPLAPRVVAKIGIALLGALEVAHAAGVLHRDVKPANVLICTDGRCVLTDFGVARVPSESNLTTPGMVLGSPHFISPERAVGGAFGPPSDLFSLGVLLYTAVEGRPPFDKGDPFETMRAVVEEEPVPPVRAGALTQVLYGLLEKDPARRWDVATARPALRALLSGPLANRTGTQVTDPYAVMRNAPAPTWAPRRGTGPAPAAPSGNIGGRAMLAPDESLADRIGATGAVDAGTGAAGGAAPATGGTPYTPPRQAHGGGHRYGGHDATAALPPGSSGDPRDAATTVGLAGAAAPGYQPGRAGAGYPAGAAGPVGYQSGYAAPGAPGHGALSGRPGGGALGRLRTAPLWMKAGLAGAVVSIVAVTVIAVTGGGGGHGPVAAPSATGPTGPLIPVQEYQGSHVTVNVPAGWKQQPPKSGGYMDYLDPQTSGNESRWVRIDVQPAGTGTTARSLLERAENRFRDGIGCASFQELVAIHDANLAGSPGAEFEYGCTPKDGTSRHGIWRVVVADGRSYGITLSVPDSRFQESKVIFDEMVRSISITAA